MGKLFGRKKKYSDDEFEDEELDDEVDDEEDDEEWYEDEDEPDDDDEEEIEDGDFDEEEIEDEDLDEDGEEEIEDEDLEDDEEEIEDEDLDEDEEEIEDEDSDEDDEEEVEVDPDDEDAADREDSYEDEMDDEEPEDEDDEEPDDDDEDDEWDEDERRAFRHRRRVRNQIIVYSVVFVFLVLVIAGCISVGRSIAGVFMAKRQAAEQEKLLEEQAAQEAQDVVIDTPETIEEPEGDSEEDYLRQIMDACLTDMPLADKVAGLFVVRPEAITGVATVTQAGDGTREALNTYAVGGLIYNEQNMLSKEQLTEMLSNTVSMSRYPIFLAIEEEGGSVSRVAGSGIGVTQVDDMPVIGASGDTTQAYEAGTTIGSYLSELGFNLDFAPVTDVAAAESGELGERAFGPDAQTAGGMVASIVEGIEGTGVSSCLKHFPGIGEVEGDTHDGRVETSKTLDEMRNNEFLPFKAGIDAGADFVMVSHVTAAAVDEEAVPSSLSKVIMTDILRNELGFQGVIITDALDVNAITQYYTSEEAAVMAINSGADMLLMPEDFQAAYEAVLAAVEDGTISEARIDESLERIYRIKAAEKLRQMEGEN